MLFTGIYDPDFESGRKTSSRGADETWPAFDQAAAAQVTEGDLYFCRSAKSSDRYWIHFDDDTHGEPGMYVATHIYRRGRWCSYLVWGESAPPFRAVVNRVGGSVSARSAHALVPVWGVGA